VTLLRAVPRRSGEEGSSAADPLSWHMRKSEADAYLTGIGEKLREIGLQTKEVLAEGRAAGQIIRYAREEDMDLIVISSHGDSGLSEWNISSVVQKVILRAYTPALIVRAYQRVPENIADLTYERLLVPLDGSKRAECTLPWARALSDFHKSTLLLTHVVKKPEVPRRAPLTERERQLVEHLTELNREKGEGYLEDLRNRLDLTAENRLLASDDPAMALHQVVDDEDVDLVIMAAHGYSGETVWPYGSIALNFIAYGSRPLLIVQDISREVAAMTEAEKAAAERAGH
jgi:nucleotide-binding universal stress UspA family protein